MAPGDAWSGVTAVGRGILCGEIPWRRHRIDRAGFHVIRERIIEEVDVSMQEIGPEGDGGAGAGLSGGAIAVLSGLGLLGVFMAQNTEDVAVSFLVWDFTLPVWLLTLGAAVVGALIWFGAGVLRRHRRRKERRANRRD